MWRHAPTNDVTALTNGISALTNAIAALKIGNSCWRTTVLFDSDARWTTGSLSIKFTELVSSAVLHHQH